MASEPKISLEPYIHLVREKSVLQHFILNITPNEVRKDS